MKIRTILLMGGLVLLGACSESKYDLDQLVPEEYHKILYVNNSGKQDLTLYDTDEDNKYTLSVVKSGSDPSLTASVKVSVLTQAELDKEYSEPEGTNYKLIGENCYSLDATTLDFSSADRYKLVNIFLKPQSVKAAMETDPEAVWVLPLQVVSENDSVNSEKNELFLQITGVITPSFGFGSSAVSVKEYSYGFAVAEKVTLGLDTENSWEISCEFGVDDAYRTAYNTKNKTIFQALPEGSYSFQDQMTLSPGTTTTELPVTINSDQLQPGDYMLPIRIESVSIFGISSTNDVYPLAIRILGPQLDRTNWTIEANTQEPNGEGSGNGVPSCALDGYPSTYWHSSWQSGSHALPHELIIDTKESYTFTQFGLMQRQHDSYMDAGAGVFYVSDDKTNWTEVGTFTMQKIHDTQNFTLETPTRGRYFKVQITQSNRGLNTSLAEIYAYGL